MSGTRFDTITFLSDYGTSDEFVGVVKCVIRDLAPHVTVVDLVHDLPAHDVRAGGLALARAIQYVPEGVVLAVVDPGVGTDRRAIAVEVAEGKGVLVGPDNGLLASAVGMAGGSERVVELTNADYHLPSPGATFAGRDVFAPVAAHLCNGVALTDLGPLVDPAGLMPGLLPLVREEDGGLACQVLWTDRFGNLQLNVDPDDIADLGRRALVRWKEGSRNAVVARTYGELPPGQLGLVVDSTGLVSVVLDRRSAAFELGLGTGDEVFLEATEGESVPVTLRSRDA